MRVYRPIERLDGAPARQYAANSGTQRTGEPKPLGLLSPHVLRRTCVHRNHVGIGAMRMTSLELHHVPHVLVLQCGRDGAQEALAGDLADGGLVERCKSVQDLALTVGDPNPNKPRPWILGFRSSCHAYPSVGLNRNLLTRNCATQLDTEM